MVRTFGNRCRTVLVGLDSAAGNFEHRRAFDSASGDLFMGQMRFVIPLPERLVPDAAEQAYLASQEGTPWECATTLAGVDLAIERETRESGYLYFPWNVP